MKIKALRNSLLIAAVIGNPLDCRTLASGNHRAFGDTRRKHGIQICPTGGAP